MKKTFQKELKYQYLSEDNSASKSIELKEGQDSSNTFVTINLNEQSSVNQNDQVSHLHEDMNFKYLKHVVLKFITSREYEVSFYINFLNNK